MKKVKHIKGNNTARLCGSKGNYESLGTENDLPICKDCQSIHLVKTGVLLK